MRTTKTVFASVCLLAICGASANAKIIELRDGTKVKAKLLKRTTTELQIEVDGLKLFIPKKEVCAIDGKDLATDWVGQCEEQLAELEAGDAEGRFRLALWCEKHGLEEQMHKLLNEVTELAPWHEEANIKLGKIKHNGLWWTKEELEAKGLVCHRGEWMTKEEADKLKDMVPYLGQWVTKKDKKMLEARKYSKWQNALQTHELCELRSDLRMIKFVNRLKMDKSQMRKALNVLAKGEAERQGFLDKRNEINAQCEVTWLRLKEAAMKGVIDSFNVSSTIEGPAGKAEKMWKDLAKAYTHRAMISCQEFISVLTVPQRQEIMYGLCGDCHCATHNAGFVEPPQEIKLSKKHCSRGGGCHTNGEFPTERGASGQAEINPKAEALLMEIRDAQPEQLDALAEKVLKTFPSRLGKTQQETVRKMRGQARQMWNVIANTTVRKLSTKENVEQFRRACGAPGCHKDVARSRSVRLLRGFAKRVKKDTGASMNARLAAMFDKALGADVSDGKPPRQKELERIHQLMKDTRRLLDQDFRERKAALCSMIEGESELASLAKLAANDAKRMALIMRPKKTQSMYTKYVLDEGRLFRILADRMKLSQRQRERLIADAVKTDTYELSDSIMFNMEERVKAGKDLYQRRCGVCHSMDKSLTAIKTAEEWRDTVKTMKHLSYNLTDKEAEVVCDYLAQRGEQDKN